MANSTKKKQQGEMMRFIFGERKEKKWEVQYILIVYLFLFFEDKTVCVCGATCRKLLLLHLRSDDLNG